jgi:ABC-type sugar transport system ATPase subunit
VEKKSVLQMAQITKEFSGVKALDNVNFTAYEGEIHSLVGENGAGKSTLMKVLSGVYPSNSYDGKLIVFGKEEKFNKPKDAEEKGIAIIHQELMLIDELTVAENISIGHLTNKHGLVDWKSVNEKAQKVLEQLNLDIDVKTKVKHLGVGQKQLVEILKALSLNSKVLILDEPTAALTENEAVQLFSVLRTLRKKGISLIYISHRMREVFDLSDRISVLRDGQLISTQKAEDITQQKVISLMVGRELSAMYPNVEISPGKEMFKLQNYSVPSTDKVGDYFIKNINLNVRSGEIVGISGLLGAGRSELMSAVFGAYKTKGIGKVFIEGCEVSIKNPKQAIKNGLAFVTEDRKQTGLLLHSSIKENISLAVLKDISKASILQKDTEKNLAQTLSNSLKVKSGSINTRVGALSGGNQQKVVIGKWLATKPKVLILDEPTRGVDVGAKLEIYNIMKELASNGVGIIMISSDLPEVLGMSDRVYVMHQGEITGELQKSEATEEKIMMYATGTDSI